ncbi:MAG: GDP-fucose synthetase [Cyanobacteria bacterium DS2.008]|uniref:GDP-L-fucose synthase family protein n=1 Tax=Blastomonas sp. TaxID=1909299 RepID=UPI00406A6DE0|nr:GDP-fucose synthetase [Cyanobacteria bacterium DS2.008]
MHNYMTANRIFVAGHNGMVGSALVERLRVAGYEVLTAERSSLDLLDANAVEQWLRKERPEAIIMAAAKVGGILANSKFPAQFIYQNLVMASNVIHAAHVCDIDELLFLGSSCIYPRDAAQPIKEDSLLTGSLEPTNQWYAVAKIAGVKLCQAYQAEYGRRYLSAMPTNLYGPRDNFELSTSHVLPALISKAHSAKLHNGEMEVWGTGSARREFLHVFDCADACLFLLKHYDGTLPVNIGFGKDIAISDLTKLICEIVGFDGEIRFDTSKPDGTPRKLLDNTRLSALGWQPQISLRNGIEETYDWFKESLAGH